MSEHPCPYADPMFKHPCGSMAQTKKPPVGHPVGTPLKGWPKPEKPR